MKNSKPLNESLESIGSILGVLAGVAGIGLSGVAIAKAQEILKEKNPELYKKLQDIGSAIEKAKGLGEGDDEKSEMLKESEFLQAAQNFVLSPAGIGTIWSLIMGGTLTVAAVKDIFAEMKEKGLKGLDGFKQAAKQIGKDLGNAIRGAKGLNESEMLKESLNAIHVLRQELNEVNLLNAKLLYLNKIFKSKNLTESQKVHVIASFDKATNIKEAKVVFESLNTALVATKKPIKESLGFASKAAGIAPSKQLIVESNDAITRMQKLANIIK
jgi:hypothetical protein